MDYDVEIEEKEEKVYFVMLDKLYEYFVVNKKEAKIESIVQILSALKPLEKEKDKKKEILEEVDII